MRDGASDTLSRYVASEQELSFRQLMHLYEQQIAQELHIEKDDDAETKVLFTRSAIEMRAAKEAALEIYYRHIQEAAQEMQDSKDESLQGIGRALESGDWSQVAI